MNSGSFSYCFCVLRSGSRNLQQLPSRWLSEVVEEVKSSDPTSKLCATRRSAGIPFYIQVDVTKRLERVRRVLEILGSHADDFKEVSALEINPLRAQRDSEPAGEQNIPVVITEIVLPGKA